MVLTVEKLRLLYKKLKSHLIENMIIGIKCTFTLKSKY